MRYVALLLLVALAIMPVSADQLISFSTDDPATLPVSWDLSAISKLYTCNVDVLDSNKNSVLGNEMSLETNIETSGTMIGEGTVFIVWEIIAPIPVTIYITPSGAMTAKDNSGRVASNYIHWTASWGEADTDDVEGCAEIVKGSLGGSAGAYEKKEIISHTGNLSDKSSSGSCQIDIETANAYSAVSAAYEATLTLVIEGI